MSRWWRYGFVSCLCDAITSGCHSAAAVGVVGVYRQHVFAVQWQEDGVHRIRWFRAAYGIQRAKKAAEVFRRTLEAVGGFQTPKYMHAI